MGQTRLKLEVLTLMMAGCLFHAQNFKIEYELNYKRDSTKNIIVKKPFLSFEVVNGKHGFQ